MNKAALVVVIMVLVVGAVLVSGCVQQGASKPSTSLDDIYSELQNISDSLNKIGDSLASSAPNAKD